MKLPRVDENTPLAPPGDSPSTSRYIAHAATRVVASIAVLAAVAAAVVSSTRGGEFGFDLAGALPALGAHGASPPAKSHRFLTKRALRSAIEHCMKGGDLSQKCESMKDWDVSFVTDMSDVFAGFANYNPDVSNWNIAQVTSTAGMFSGASGFDGDLGAWDVSNVVDMSGMFRGATAFTGRGLERWDVGKATDATMTFRGAKSFVADISRWNVANVVHMDGMFEQATAFDVDLNPPMSAWDACKPTREKMFSGATAMEKDVAKQPRESQPGCGVAPPPPPIDGDHL
jgi:hypothetical protein